LGLHDLLLTQLELLVQPALTCAAAAAAACPAADLQYNQNATGNIKFPGKTHKGFTKLANMLWLQGVREALYSNAVKGLVTSVSIAGHSMGASVATLLSFAAQVGSAAG
jgi:esterase/lipase